MSVELLERLQQSGKGQSARDLLRSLRDHFISLNGTGGFSRRNFLKGGAATAAALQVLARASKSAHARELTRARGGRRQMKGTSTAQGAADPSIMKLIDRGTFGFTRAAVSEAESMGFENWLEWQLAYESIDDSDLDSRIAAYDTLTMTAQEILDAYDLNSAVPALQLMEAAILRSVYSRRQLYERMVEFWTDHINIYIFADFPLLKVVDDREVIRQHALGNFPDMIRASARSGAMLLYLDNYANVVGNAQENYARELMELHTMGVHGGYTQQDVQEVARCLTGWTLNLRTNGGIVDFGEFLFNPNRHDYNPKFVLGQQIDNPPPNGIEDGNQVIDMLVAHPSTAQFISTKMCKRFLGYDPPEDIVTAVRDTYLATGGDIKEMLRVIFQPTVMTYLTTPKFKRPFHLAASLLRATEAEIEDPSVLLQYTVILGQAPFFWIPPDGYPDSLEAWSTSLLPRWQFASRLLDLFIPFAVIDSDALMTSAGGDDPGEQANAVDAVLTGGRLPDDELALLQDFYDNGVPPGYILANREMFGLAASMPTFQWY